MSVMTMRFVHSTAIVLLAVVAAFSEPLHIAWDHVEAAHHCNDHSSVSTHHGEHSHCGGDEHGHIVPLEQQRSSALCPNDSSCCENGDSSHHDFHATEHQPGSLRTQFDKQLLSALASWDADFSHPEQGVLNVDMALACPPDSFLTASVLRRGPPVVIL